MKTARQKSQPAAYRHYIEARLAYLREALESQAADAIAKNGPPVRSKLAKAAQEAAEAMEEASPIAVLAETFGLSEFELDILLICAGVELDGAFAKVCSEAAGAVHGAPTFGLALAALPNAEWSAVSAASPLRLWNLVEPGEASSLVLSPLRIDESVLHFLGGLPFADQKIRSLIQPFEERNEPAPSHRVIAEEIALAWADAASSDRGYVVVELYGDEASAKCDIAREVARLLKMNILRIAVHSIPESTAELDRLARLWNRQALLGSCVLMLDAEDYDSDAPLRDRSLPDFLNRVANPVIVAGRKRMRSIARPFLSVEVRPLPTREQTDLWAHELRVSGLEADGLAESVVTQFSLSAPGIRTACAIARGRVQRDRNQGEDAPDIHAHLWNVCRTQTRARLGDLAQVVPPSAQWDDLVLPDAQLRVLREILIHVRHRNLVFHTWGFAKGEDRGLGTTALFAGSSGTGKTMAAEVLANALNLDLYRIDLSAVVNKYIGETEKNLRRVFDAAEESGAILLFDEADALFGKRSEVKDSHDRYANIEVGYLLQRMEAYRGLAVLTTNMKESLDQAFLRRIRFIVHFPFPDAAEREQIWRRAFPSRTPLAGVDPAKLAGLNVAGGNIRNIALQAAFFAAESQQPVGMAHVLEAARSEYNKLQRTLTDGELNSMRDTQAAILATKSTA